MFFFAVSDDTQQTLSLTLIVHSVSHATQDMFLLRCILCFVITVLTFSTKLVWCKYATVSTILHPYYDYDAGTFY